MSAENPILLLLEDSANAGLVIQRTVLRSLPEYRLVWARTVQEARIITCETPVALFLLDVELPDGNGIDFLMEAALIHSEAGAIVMTGNPLPVYRRRTEALGIRFLEKPVAPADLQCCLREMLDSKDPSNSDGKFEGRLRGLTPVDLIQLKCMANATTMLHFQSPAGEGRVFFENGAIIHAQTSRASGQEALDQIVGFVGGKISQEQLVPATRTIHRDWQSALMHAAHAHDVVNQKA
jgi:CheY-like chemotaxis protein